MPRQESVVPLEKEVEHKQVLVDKAEDRLNRLSKLLQSKSINESEYLTAKFDLKLAEADLSRSMAELDLIKSGAWESDVLVAKAEVAKALANLDRLKLELDRCVIKSPIDGTILDIKVSQGEFISPEDEAVIIGKTDILYVEASFDEQFIADFDFANRTVMVIKGNEAKYELNYVRTIPRAVPKTNLNGLSNELIDSRVVKVIYEIVSPKNLIVGQQVEVQVIR
jgi:multidrug resistance efflux pump